MYMYTGGRIAHPASGRTSADLGRLCGGQLSRDSHACMPVALPKANSLLRIKEASLGSWACGPVSDDQQEEVRCYARDFKTARSPLSDPALKLGLAPSGSRHKHNRLIIRWPGGGHEAPKAAGRHFLLRSMPHEACLPSYQVPKPWFAPKGVFVFVQRLNGRTWSLADSKAHFWVAVKELNLSCHNRDT